jgi:hypothetical protein
LIGVAPTDYVGIESRSALFEVTAGFVAALALGVAASLISDRTVPSGLVAALFGAGCALWLGAILLLLVSYLRIRKLTMGVVPPPRKVTTASGVWSLVFGAASILLFVLTSIAFYLGLHPDPDFSSVYDGQDPRASGCWDAASKPLPNQKPVNIYDLDGRTIGTVKLIGSPICGTIWGEISVTADKREHVRGLTARIVMHRPADEVDAPYPLKLKGGERGNSNMISAVEVCAQATVYLTDGSRQGPPSTTACRFEDL